MRLATFSEAFSGPRFRIVRPGWLFHFGARRLTAILAGSWHFGISPYGFNEM